MVLKSVKIWKSSSVQPALGKHYRSYLQDFDLDFLDHLCYKHE